MFDHYHQEPILGICYYPDPAKWSDSLMERDLTETALAGIRVVWLSYDRHYVARSGNCGSCSTRLNRGQEILCNV
jgi:hypothetical protein